MLQKTRIAEVLPSAARTASGSVDLNELPGNFDEVVGYVDVTAASGTSPTLDVTYQVSPDDGITWYDHTAFTQAVAVTKERKVFTAPAGVRGRISYTIGGTSPSFTFSVHVEGKRHG